MRRPLRHFARLLPVLLPLAWLGWTGIRGVDFDRHWDERQMVLLVRASIEEERQLPGWYHYPSMCFRLARAALWPAAVRGATKDELVAETVRWRYRLRVRTIFLCVSALAVLWVYGTALVLSRTVLEALLAAGIVATSWQWTYHARWFAPDAVMGQFGALALLGAAVAVTSGRRGGAFLAAVGAGLAAATKYTGGVFLLPALAAAWWRRDATPPAGRRRDAAVVLLLFGATFLAITPGAVVEPAKFLEDVRYEAVHYREMGHYGHTVEPGTGLAARIGRYVARDLPSPYDAASIAITLLAAVGAVVLARRRRFLLALVAAAPAVLVLAMTAQRVLFVRNLLPLLPPLALLAAIGAGTLAAAAGRRAAPSVLLFGSLLLVTPGAVFNHHAAQAIATHEDAGPARDLAAWMREHPEAKVLALPSVADALRLQEDAPPHLDDPADPAVELVAFTLLDHPAPGRLPSNVPDRTVAWFGPRDVDLEYYTAWLEPWIFLVPRETAVEWNVFDASRGD